MERFFWGGLIVSAARSPPPWGGGFSRFARSPVCYESDARTAFEGLGLLAHRAPKVAAWEVSA